MVRGLVALILTGEDGDLLSQQRQDVGSPYGVRLLQA